MSTTSRFTPDCCPDCQGRIEAPYSEYRHARQHVLFWPLLAGGLLVLILLTVFLFWTTARSTIELLDGQGLRRKERGLIFFLFLAATVPVIFWLGRLWWRFLLRLPRALAFTCSTCHWTGTVQVRDGADLVKDDMGVRIEFEDPPPPPDAYVLRRERQWQRRSSRRPESDEPEPPPNPDFDFR